jgi:hypothetical protein
MMKTLAKLTCISEYSCIRIAIVIIKCSSSIMYVCKCIRESWQGIVQEGARGSPPVDRRDPLGQVDVSFRALKDPGVFQQISRVWSLVGRPDKADVGVRRNQPPSKSHHIRHKPTIEPKSPALRRSTRSFARANRSTGARAGPR